MGKGRILLRAVYTVIFAFCANSYCLWIREIRWLWAVGAGLILVNILCGSTDLTVKKLRNKFLDHGVECLIVFVLSLIYSAVFHVILVIMIPTEYKVYLMSALFCYAAHFVLFWNGIISVYATSIQLGIKLRVIGLVCGPIPVAHFFALRKIILITREEVRFEAEKDLLNRKREKESICKTKYPILLVHGVFFRDSEKLNYWGRVPSELLRNGASLYYGDHQSALSVPDSAAELSERIKNIVAKATKGIANYNCESTIDCAIINDEWNEIRNHIGSNSVIIQYRPHSNTKASETLEALKSDLKIKVTMDMYHIAIALPLPHLQKQNLVVR